MVLLSGIQFVLWTLGAVLAGMASYLLLLTVAAWLAPARHPHAARTGVHRFAFLIPAHNEEVLLPKLLANLQGLDYPRSRYAIHVVADNCTDRTAALGRELGAQVHERFDSVNLGKGHALQWLLQRVTTATPTFDAAVIIDADSVVSTNFLQVMDAHLQRGAQVVQSYDGVLDADRSWAVSLRAAAMAVLNYVRPQGRMLLGGSAGLKGNGMVFHRHILERHAWSASVTEDLEYHMTLILHGERVIFAPDAVVWAEMPETLANSHTQNVRWEQGRLEMARHYIPRLLWAALTPWRHGGWQRIPLLLDAMMELVVPPFAVLAALSLLFGAGAFWLGSFALWLAGYVLLAQVFYLVSGLRLTHAPSRVYLAFLYVPMFLVWKLWLYVRVVLKLENQGWVRATRDTAPQ
jgi:cellulose synthase/poly-beta-1,6-N-acetylglucosamine synthase-like glycosyltransferase